MDQSFKITHEVMMGSTLSYLIRMNGEHMAFTDTEREAQLVVDSFAAHEQSRLEGEWIRVYRQDLEGGKKVVISTQKLGRIVNGSIKEELVLDYVSVGHCTMHGDRRSLVPEAPLLRPELLLPPPGFGLLAKIEEAKKIEEDVEEKDDTWTSEEEVSEGEMEIEDEE